MSVRSSQRTPRRAARLLLAVLAPLLAVAVQSPIVHGQPGTLVFPGMEIHQDTVLCTLGYVDPATRIAYTAGHCRASGTVSDKFGAPIGLQGTFRDNTPDGMTIDTNHQITDWEVIHLDPAVAINNVLPSGKALVTDPAVRPVRGMPVCHFGVVTGESCGTIESVNNGWFTMANGVVSRKGDSGGPVYTPTPDGRTVLVGLFNSTWGTLPAAISWEVASQQAQADTISAASAVTTAPALP